MKTTYDEAVAHAKTLNSDFVWILTKDHKGYAAVPSKNIDHILTMGWYICGSVKREYKVLTMFGGYVPDPEVQGEDPNEYVFSNGMKIYLSDDLQ